MGFVGGRDLRSDVYVKEVLGKYDVLKKSGFWPAEPLLRPRAWLANFEPGDKHIAAMLLDSFTYFDDKLTDRLLAASYNSIGDDFPKGPAAPARQELVSAVGDAVFTPVLGERPNPTDSGNLICRKLRQVVDVPQDRIVGFSEALEHAYSGRCVVFVDDFVGSGNQFIETFSRLESDQTPRSFVDAQTKTGFVCIYVTLICTQFGYDRIHKALPNVAISCTHVVGEEASIWGFDRTNPSSYLEIMDLLRRSSSRLTPSEDHMQGTAEKTLGFAQRGLMLGFEHSVPDATLPIFWSKGVNNWEPLIERK